MIKKLIITTLLLVALPAAAQTWVNPYTGGTSGSGFLPTNSINQTPGATASTPGASAGVPGTVSDYTPLEPLKAGFSSYRNFSDYLGTIYKLTITIGALIAVVMLVTGGVRYMLSEGFTDIDKAKLRIRSALWGLLVLVGSFLILYSINPNLLNFNLLIPPLKQQNASNFNPATGGSGSAGQQVLTPTPMTAAQGVAVGAVLGCQDGSITSFVGCSGWGSYISYNSSQANEADVQQAIRNYTSSCEGWTNAWIGNVRRIDGSVMGAPGQTALVCAGPGVK